MMTMTTAHKIHLMQGVNGTPACACNGMDKNNKIRRNARTTYQHMGAKSVSPEDFRATPSDQRCSHCCDRFTPMMNARRAIVGKPLYSDAMTKQLK
jgi:hypothetical protein